MSEGQLALWLSENIKSSPMMWTKIWFEIGNWNMSGQIPIEGWGWIEIDFELDCRHKWKGFEAEHVNFKFDSKYSRCLRSIGKLPDLIKSRVKPLEDFLENIPVKN